MIIMRASCSTETQGDHLPCWQETGQVSGLKQYIANIFILTIEATALRKH